MAMLSSFLRLFCLAHESLMCPTMAVMCETFTGRQSGMAKMQDDKNSSLSINEEAEEMVKEVSDKEIKEAMFDIEDNRAPGPDGFSSVFFKKACNVVGRDVYAAIKEFFSNRQMLGELNATLITLVYGGRIGPKRCDMKIDLQKAYGYEDGTLFDSLQISIWEVIQNGNGPVSVTTDTSGQIKILPPKTGEEVVARERERKARTSLLMAIPEDHLAKFHKMLMQKKCCNASNPDWFGNDESKKDAETGGEYDLEEMDLKWQVAMISMRIKKFYKKTGRKLQFDAKEPVGFDKTKVECYNCHKTGHFARECRTKEDNRRRDGWNSGNKDGSRTGKKEESKALVTVDGESVDWTTHSENDEDYAFMASNSSGSDTQVTSCSNECKESYANLKRLYDAQREQLSDVVEIKGLYSVLRKLKQGLVAIQQVSDQLSIKSNIEVQPKVWSDAPIIEEYESDYLYGGPVALVLVKAFITGNGKIKNIGKLDVEDVSFVIELSLSIIFYVSQHCVTKEQVPRQNNMYSFNLENIVPLGGLACLIAKATTDESNLWHRRLGHVNFKNLKLGCEETLSEVTTKLFKMTKLELLVRKECNTKLLV
ncbi:ribonuclease H-like domain-containing protein [Tanacetum coccineum]